MNFNFTLKCDACGTNTNCRVGLSNRHDQPLRFCCQECSAPIDLNITQKGKGLKGATEVAGHQPFDAGTNFVDLHLDFPVSFEPYVMGETPFMRAIGRIGFDAMQLHSGRLNYLNDEMGKAHVFSLLLKHYVRDKHTPYRMALKRDYGIELKSDRPEDINAGLYNLIAKMMMPFAYPKQDQEAVHDFEAALFGKVGSDKAAIDAFVDELVETGFLKNLQIDCLEIYPKIVAAEMPLRPALFLDFDEDYHETLSPMRISLDKFESYKDLFKDISEIISRQLVIVAGINNIQKRGDHNVFLPLVSGGGKDLHPKNLNEYADVDFGNKLNFIDDSWFEFLDGSTSNHLRNAIAHYKAEYDDVTQVITYFPKKEGLKQNKNETIYFLEFMRRLLLVYREMHRLHHSIKCLFYYRYIIQKK